MTPADGEDGFTLIELLMAIAITSIILVTMGFAVTEGFQNTTTTKTSIDRSLLGSFAARYFAADIASTTYGPASIKTPTTTPAARPCGASATAANTAVDIQTGDNTAVTYAVLTLADGRKSLARTVCSGTSTGPLTQTSRQIVGTTDASLVANANASCATSTSCALTLSWATAPTYSITVNGTRWVNATTTTTVAP
jgi:prepilin-type N-terminal cleavage/methylation domain-containing protein